MYMLPKDSFTDTVTLKLETFIRVCVSSFNVIEMIIDIENFGGMGWGWVGGG